MLIKVNVLKRLKIIENNLEKIKITNTSDQENIISLGKIVLRTSPKDNLWMAPYGLLCNDKGHPLLTSFGR